LGLQAAWSWFFPALLSLLAPIALQAQDDATGKTSLESEIRFSMVGESQFKERSKIGSIDGYDLGTRDVFSFRVHEGVLFRFGLELDRNSFSVPNSTPLPSKLQAASVVVGADFQLGDAWIFRFEAQPGFYGSGTNIRGRNIDVPIVLGASYFVSSDFQVAVGLSIDPERKYPVLPGLGFRYKLSANWVLDMILPTPRIEYSYSKSLLLYAGGNIEDGSYRTDGDFGTVHGDPRLNAAVVDYTQIRVGGGASWKIRPSWTLEFEAGVVPVQEFDFHRADIKARSTEIPPYGSLVLKAAF
jgi:hypothetical protein